MDHVTAVFRTRGDAEEALRRIEALGISHQSVSMLVSDETRGKAFGFTKGTKSEKGLAAGATVGGLVGAVLAGLVSAGAVAIPGMNLVISGYLVSAAAGLGAGAATGGVVGALIGLGFEENEAKFYEKELEGGNILLAVEVRDSEEKRRVQEILDDTESYSFDPSVSVPPRTISDANARLR